jgi:hypothetical protein
MYGGWGPAEIAEVKPEWLAGYAAEGVVFDSAESARFTWWDHEVCHLLLKHGAAHFRRIAIWDCDWKAVAREAGCEEARALDDPRSAVERLAHYLLKLTQGHRARWDVRCLERLLRSSGW